MILNSTVLGQIPMKFYEFLSMFVNFLYQKKEIIPDIFQIDFVFCLFPLNIDVMKNAQ